ncbi:MAG: hypothetical protein GY714_19945 [Desulfobacterales bacterium]|nr:hypothetical protein [Desulfobacterales bacterium]
MRVIQIEESKFNELFANLRKDLELKKFTCRELIDPRDQIDTMSHEMHRHFNYHICKFKDKLEEG